MIDDDIHLNRSDNELLFNALIQLIIQQFPLLDSREMMYHMPSFWDLAEQDWVSGDTSSLIPNK